MPVASARRFRSKDQRDADGFQHRQNCEKNNEHARKVQKEKLPKVGAVVGLRRCSTEVNYSDSHWSPVAADRCVGNFVHSTLLQFIHIING